MTPDIMDPRVCVTQVEGDDRLTLTLTLTISDGPASHSHQITTAQARALSLELIKHAYQAELRNKKSDKTELSHAVPFRLGHQTRA